MLFDLESDPEELNNLAEDETCKPVVSDLHDVLLRTWDPERYRTDALASQKRQWFIQDVMSKTSANPWDFQPFTNAREQYVRSGANTTFVKGQARFPYVEPAEPDKPRDA